MPELALHLLVFSVVGILFLAAPLVIGRLLRPRQPNAVKLMAYECGEEPIGGSDVRFDLRYYVVALLFLVFDVELALLFPWATLYGTTVQLADTALSDSARGVISARLLTAPGEMLPADMAIQFAVVAFCELILFFGLLVLGFAYLWKRGDLDWVHTLRGQAGEKPA
jgi:NADH-quinone oxidoreductase subunit A